MENDNSGALFKNDRKEQEKQPDYKGSLTVNGSEYWISAWLNESKSGQKYMGLKVNLKEQQQALGRVAGQHQPRDARRQRPGLAGAGARDDQQWAGDQTLTTAPTELRSRTLCLVQGRERIIGGRGRQIGGSGLAHAESLVHPSPVRPYRSHACPKKSTRAPATASGRSQWNM